MKKNYQIIKKIKIYGLYNKFIRKNSYVLNIFCIFVKKIVMKNCIDKTKLKINLLVLENVNHLDSDLNSYLTTYHKDNNVNIVYNVLNLNKDDIINHLKSCDCICLSSSFYDIDQFNDIVKLINIFINIKRIEILYLFTNSDYKFVQFLNINMSDELVNIIKTRDVIEIQSTKYINNSDKFFSKESFTFDCIDIYYNSDKNMIWLERQPVVNFIKDYCKYDIRVEYLKQILSNLNKRLPKSEYTFTISENNISDFNNLKSEIISTINYRQEVEKDIELIEENKKWLEILNKM